VIDEKRWRALVRSLRRDIIRHFPDWTGGNVHDPGITLLELFAFLAENLLYRSGAAGVESAGRKREALLRMNYFAGQLLDVEDFTAEQDYFREKLRRRNRRLHGAGVVSGLGVSIDRRKGAARVVVSPGFALDPLGEEIEVPRRISLPLSAKVKARWVQVRYAERLRRPSPAPGSAGRSGTRPYARVEETFEVLLAPAARANAVSLARLTRAGGKWALDPRFCPTRARV
jgi:hypothetical protein